MICKACGAELPDGARFCHVCGSRVEEAAEEAAPEVTGETPVEETPVEETPVEETPVEEVPVEEVPVEEAPVEEAPVEETAVEEVPVEEVPVEEVPVEEVPVEEVPVEEAPVQPPYGDGPVPPVPEGDAGKKKKKWLIPAVIAAVVVVALLVIAVLPGLRLALAKPDDLYHQVEMKGLRDVSMSAASFYGHALSAGSKLDDMGTSGSAEVSFGKEFYELMDSYADLDLSWLKKVALDYAFNQKDGRSGGAVTLKLNSQKLATVNLVLDREEEQVFLQIPDVSKDYMSMDLDDLLWDLRYSLGYSAYNLFSTLLTGMDEEDEEQAKALMAALPTRDQAEKLVNKYLQIAVNSIQDVEKGRDTLTAGDVTAEYTTLKVVINAKTAAKIAENVLTELKKDKDVEKYIKNIAKALEADEDLYDEFLEELDEILEDVEDIKDYSGKEKITMTLYIDGKGNIRGREIRTNFYPNIKFLYATPIKGGNMGIEISLKQDGDSLFSLTGSGKLSGATLSADTVLKIQGVAAAEIKLEKADGARLKKGEFKGIVTLKPSADLVNELDLGSAAGRVVKKISLTLDLDTNDGSSKMKLSVNYEDSPLVTLSADGKTGSGKKVDGVKDALDADDWAEELDTKKLKDLIKTLKKAGVPSEYLEELEDAIDRIA